MPAHRSFPFGVLIICTALIAACHGGSTPQPGAGQQIEPLVALPDAHAGGSLPDRLADSTYWRMIREFSEPGGYFQSENFVSNEMLLQHVVSRLRPVMPPGGVYLGVGPEQNFTYIAALRPRVVFIVDIRRLNLLQHLWYKSIFELSPTRASFLSRLFARPMAASAVNRFGAMARGDSLVALLERTAPDSLLFRRTFDAVRRQLTVVHGFTLDSSDLATLAYVDSVFYRSGPELNYSSGANGNGTGYNNFRRMPTFAMIAGTTDEHGNNVGFLGSDSAYRYVRDLERRNLVIPVVGNFSGPRALRAVGTWLSERHATLGAFYLSNVEQYLFRQTDDWMRFYANVAALPLDSNSQFIRSTSGGRGFGRGPNGSPVMLMTQLLSPIGPIVDAARNGSLGGYQDVIARSR